MPAQRGSSFLLDLGSGQSRDDYRTVAGLRTTHLSITGEPVVVTNHGSGGWQNLLSGAGVRSMSVTGSGVFMGSVEELEVRSLALGGVIAPFRLSFEGGERLSGAFLVSHLEYAGDHDGERLYSLSLESSGEIVSD